MERLAIDRLRVEEAKCDRLVSASFLPRAKLSVWDQADAAQIDEFAFQFTGGAHEQAVRALFQIHRSKLELFELIESTGAADLPLELREIGLDDEFVAGVLVVAGVEQVDSVASVRWGLQVPQCRVARHDPWADDV